MRTDRAGCRGQDRDGGKGRGGVDGGWWEKSSLGTGNYSDFFEKCELMMPEMSFSMSR